MCLGAFNLNLQGCKNTGDFISKQPEPLRSGLQLGNKFFTKRMKKIDKVSRISKKLNCFPEEWGK